MISNRCARKSLVTNCNSIISKNYLRFLVDSNERIYIVLSKLCCMKFLYNPIFEKRSFYVLQFFIHNVVKRILKTC